VPRAIKPDLRLTSRRLKDPPRRVGIEIGPALSPIGTFRTWRNVRFESVMHSKAGVYEALPFKLIFFVLVEGWSLVAGSLVQSYGG
jgi:hypothetical protein